MTYTTAGNIGFRFKLPLADAAKALDVPIRIEYNGAVLNSDWYAGFAARFQR